MNSKVSPNEEAAVAGVEAASLWDGFTVIDVVSRADLLACGDLIDASAQALTAGFRVPLAISRSAWGMLVSDNDPDAQAHRLFQLLLMAKMSTLAVRNSNVTRFDCDGSTVLLHCGPGDCAKPVLTLMFEEDY